MVQLDRLINAFSRGIDDLGGSRDSHELRGELAGSQEEIERKLQFVNPHVTFPMHILHMLCKFREWCRKLRPCVCVFVCLCCCMFMCLCVLYVCELVCLSACSTTV